MKQQTLFGSLWRKARRGLGGKAPSILIAGTATGSGKSWTATAICRLLKRRGVRAVPFQAVSLSGDAVRCSRGGSIAVEQARQAEACGVAPTTDMNPLRCVAAPGGGYDVLAEGQAWKSLARFDFSDCLDEAEEKIGAAYERLAAQADLVVVDGMGGSAELDRADVANLSLAERFGSRVLLTCNAERGGAFAAVVGTIALLEKPQQALVKAFLINGFRGVTGSFDSGVEIIEERGGRPCLGVLPHSRTIRLGAVSAEAGAAISKDELRVVIIDLPGRATDEQFSLLTQAEYVTEPTRYDPDVIIIPPTSSSLGDLLWMKKSGLDRWVLDRRKEGTAIWGFGGGCHLLGRFVSDPSAGTPERQRVPSLGLLPMLTDILPDRGAKEVSVKLWEKSVSFAAQAPIGAADTLAAGPSPFAEVDGQPEGFRQRGIVGTVLEGALHSAEVVEDLLEEVLQRRSRPAKTVETSATREEHYEKLADWFEQHADVALFDELFLK